MRQIETKVLIDTPAERVWQVLTNFHLYPEWNPFVRLIEGPLEEGRKIRIRVVPPGSKGMGFRPRIMRVLPKQEFRWKGKLGIGGLFDGEHYFLIKELGPEQTQLTHGERFSGLLVGMMGNTLEQTRQGFEQMNEALKKRCEQYPEICAT